MFEAANVPYQCRVVPFPFGFQPRFGSSTPRSNDYTIVSSVRNRYTLTTV